MAEGKDLSGHEYRFAYDIQLKDNFESTIFREAFASQFILWHFKFSKARQLDRLEIAEF